MQHGDLIMVSKNTHTTHTQAQKKKEESAAAQEDGDGKKNGRKGKLFRR